MVLGILEITILYSLPLQLLVIKLKYVCALQKVKNKMATAFVNYIF